MYIKKLNITNFGKFKNKEIPFSPGLNIIYGHNEDGKSTIHNFISGIFYGFAKIGAKRKNYTEELEKYRPWDAQQYSGSLILSLDDNDYRIERNFLKDRDFTKVFNVTRGKDISDTINMQENSKINQPGNYFFGINQSTFENTIHFSQMNLRTNDNFKDGLAERLINFNHSKSESISLEKAFVYLNDQLKIIGTEQAKTTPLGSLKQEIADKKSMIREKTAEKQQYEIALRELSKSLESKNLLEENIEKLKEEKRIYNEKVEHNKYLNILENLNKIKDIEEKLSQEHIYGNSSEDFKLCEEKRNFLRFHHSKADDFLYQINELKKELNRQDIQAHSYLNEVKADSDMFQNALEEESELNRTNYSKEREFLSKDITRIGRERTKFTMVISASIVIMILLLLLSFYMDNYIILIALIIPLIYAYLRVGKLRESLELYKRLNMQMEKLRELSFIKRKKRDNIDEVINSLLEKYSIENRSSLNSFFNEELKIFQEREYRNKFNIDRLKNISDKYEKEKVVIEELEYEFNAIIEKYNCNNFHEFEQLAYSNDVELLEGDRQKLLEINRVLLGDSKLEELKHTASYTTHIKNIGEIEENLAVYIDKLDSDNEKISRLEERIKMLEESLKYVQNLQEEVRNLEIQFFQLSEKREDILLTKEILTKISMDNRDYFTPAMSKETSDLLYKITNGKYDKLIIDGQNNINVLDRTLNKLVSIETLSKGTIDQIYIAFRLAVLKVLEKEDVPLIFDDSFNQFDDFRIENILKVLSTIKESRQIIILTSQKREANILQKLDKEHNIISIHEE